MATRLDLDGNPIKPMTICMIGAGGFIGSHLCEKLMAETPHTVLAVDVYNDKIKHLLEKFCKKTLIYIYYILNIDK